MRERWVEVSCNRVSVTGDASVPSSSAAAAQFNIKEGDTGHLYSSAQQLAVGLGDMA